MAVAIKDRPRRIEIPGDVLVLDEDFCKEVLAGAARRTGQRLEAEGCPYVIIAGCKYRPLHAGRKWLAARITQPNQPQRRRRT